MSLFSILAAATIIVLFTLSAMLNKGRARKTALIVNCVLLLLAAGCGTGFFIDNENVRKAEDGQDIYGYFFNEVYYSEEADGCYIFSKPEIMSPPSMYAAKTDKLELPAISKIYTPVRFYMEDGAFLDSGSITVGGENGGRFSEINYSEIIRITPDPSWALILTALASTVIMAAFSIVMVIRGIIKR